MAYVSCIGRRVHINIKSQGSKVQAVGRAHAKVLGQMCWRNCAGGPLWLKQSEWGGWVEGVLQGLVSGGEDLDFYPQRKGRGT